MKKIILTAAMMAACAAGQAYAADNAAPEAKPDNETSFNVAVVSDYRYRGISQTRLKPALQGGIDYTHNPSGFYVGAWASTIKWTKDAGGGGDAEMDFYAGRRGQVFGGLSYDAGVLSYVYPSSELSHVAGFANANTVEVYGQISDGTAYAKYSHSVTNLFGYIDSKGSGYLDVGANIEAIYGVTVNLHVGRQTVHNNGVANYTDWKAGVTKDFGLLTGALAMIGTNASKTAYASPVNGKFMGKTALQLTVSRTF